MLINAAPADEIAEIRGQIRMLQDREAELRAGFLSGLHGWEGAEYAVELTQQRRRVLLKDRLPEAILNDPRYWDERVTQTLKVQPRQVEPDEFDVVEPFD